MRLAVSGVSLAASRSRSAPTPLAKTLRRTRRKEVGWAVGSVLCGKNNQGFDKLCCL